MTIMELAAIPLWTLGVAGATTGALALVLCAFADDSLFIPDLSRRKNPDLGLGPRYRLGPVPPAR
jgi:hypothetical protein